MQTSAMGTPTSRAEFEHNLFLLRELINQRKVFFMRGIRTDGLSRVRPLPNGRIDLLSIDEATRLQANMCAQLPSFPPQGDDPHADAIAEGEASAEQQCVSTEHEDDQGTGDVE